LYKLTYISVVIFYVRACYYYVCVYDVFITELHGCSLTKYIKATFYFILFYLNVTGLDFNV